MTPITSTLLTPRNRGDFHIAVICALELEAECVYNVLDHVWDGKEYGVAATDDNAYTLGSIGEHNVVLVHMPGMGTDRAAFVAANLRSSFTQVKLALVVGVCGGMPFSVKDEEITLGDIIVSEALVRYDFGRQYRQGFKRKTDVHDVLGPPTEKILAFLKRLKTNQYKTALHSSVAIILEALHRKSPDLRHPGVERDTLYHSAYTHQHRLPENCDTCDKGGNICKEAVNADFEDLGCDASMRVTRSRLAGTLTTQPRIHFGTMGSANTVMKSGYHRDELAKEGIIAVEMEGAGVWRYGPTVVIKGVCDYADSHKRKGWQRYAAATAAACTKAFLLEWRPEQREGNSAGVDVLFDVPNERVKVLFGREKELTTIATYFDRVHDETSRPRILVLHAMGGQGKSQIALEYCHRARRTHRGVFWINGSSLSAIIQSLVGIAHRLDSSATQILPNDEARAQFAIRTLEGWSQRWLMVVDNCDDVTIFPQLRGLFIPQVGKGNILFTSRHRNLEHLGDLIEVPPMSLREGVQLLLHRYRGVNVDDHLSEGAKIVNRLGNLALAIDQASAYMHYVHLPLNSLSTFLPRYLSQREKILKHTTPAFWNYMKICGSDEQETAISAFTTWEMSFKQLLQNHQNGNLVAHILTLSAFFAPIAIDESLFRLHLHIHKNLVTWAALFTAGTDHNNDQTSVPVGLEQEKLAASPVLSEHAARVARLCKMFGWRIDVESYNTAASHAVISGLSHTIEPTSTDSECEYWSTDSFWQVIHQTFQISLVQSISPAVESRGASFLLHPLIRDWLQLRLAIKERQTHTREAIDVLISSIKVYTDRGSQALTKMATLLHMDAVIGCDNEFFNTDSRLGQDISTCNKSCWFALFYDTQGRYIEAERIFRRVMELEERVLGKEHPNTLMTMNNLGLALINQGKHSEAERIYRGVVEVREKMLGKEHPDTLTGMGNLASALGHRGKYNEAERIYREVGEVLQRVLGREHPDTLTGMSNLASVLDNRGKHNEAERIHREVGEVLERVLGREHPNTLIGINNLALTLSKQGKHNEAERIYRGVMEVQERVLGREHPETLISINNLALVLFH